jgi:hypothetical protein
VAGVDPGGLGALCRRVVLCRRLALWRRLAFCRRVVFCGRLALCRRVAGGRLASWPRLALAVFCWRAELVCFTGGSAFADAAPTTSTEAITRTQLKSARRRARFKRWNARAADTNPVHRPSPPFRRPAAQAVAI